MSAIYQVDTDLHLVPVLGLRPLNEILIVHKGLLLLAWSQQTSPGIVTVKTAELK